MPPLLSVAEARAAVLAACSALDAESAPVDEALDRVLAEDLTAAADVPRWAVSAMDGFAVAAGPAGRRLRIAGEARAGRPSEAGLGGGEAIRISTGAVLPSGAEAVVRVEDTEERDGWVLLGAAATAEQHINAAGSDMRAGDRLLHPGTRLGAAELGVAVAAGRGELRVARRPRVTILSSGDELVAPGGSLGPGQIHNSNAVTLAALARRAGASVRTAGRMLDTEAATREALEAAFADTDLLLISGGVSVGPHDHVKPALAAAGAEERFWRVALRPGKPTWFGVLGDCPVLGLPGNPVSAMVTFTLFAAPALAVLQGADPRPRVRSALLDRDLPRHRERDEAVRVTLEARDGALHARPTGPQGSHRLTSMLGADGLLMVARGEGALAAGSAVEVDLL